MSMMRCRLLDDTVRRTAEGESMAVRSVARMRPGLSIYGKSHQNTVAGNQLIPMTVGEEIVSKDGFVSAICTEGGVNIEAMPGASVNASSDIYFIGTGSSLNDYEEYPDFEAGMTYTAKCDSINYSLYVTALRGGAGTLICQVNSETGSRTFSPQEGDTFRVLLRPNKNFTETENDVVHVMISSNMDAPIWEPYTGGQPSPNPDYPQEIVSVGDDGEIGVDVYGGNLFDASKCNIDDAPVSEFQYFPISVQEDGQYTLSSDSPMDGSGGSGLSALICFLSGNVMEGASSYDNGVYDGHPITQSSENGYVTIAMRKSLICSALDYNIMLNIGTTALPFEPYKQPQSLIVSTPNGLPGIPVSSDGNYTDENGQQWISDEVDFKRGKYVKRAELLHITDFSNTSEPTHTDLGNTECNIQILGHYPDVQNMTHVDSSMCDSFIYSAIGDYERFAIGSDTELRVYFTLNGVLSREEFIAKMEEISPTILFPLATPIKTDLTPEQITAYQSLHTNYPTTTVMNDERAGMKLTYKTRKSLEVT